MLRLKRAYEPPARDDGERILVERLWPRGVTKAALAADEWAKDVAPSTALRRWFGHQEERWDEFRRRYRDELDANPRAWEPLREASRRGPVTLLYAAHDTSHNGALVLRDYLIEHGAARGSSRAKRPGHRSKTSRTSAARAGRTRGRRP